MANAATLVQADWTLHLMLSTFGWRPAPRLESTIVEVPFRVALSESNLLGELAERLRENDCAVFQIGERALDVRHMSARDDDEARTELTFFVRAWRLAHPAVDVVIL